MVHVLGWTTAETAAQLGLAGGTVRGYLADAVKTLRRELADRNPRAAGREVAK